MRAAGQTTGLVARSFASRLPAHVVAALSPSQTALRVYGIQLDETACIACGSVFESATWPAPFCPGCRAPLPRRCVGHKGNRCQAVMQPTPRKRVRPSGEVVTVYDAPEPYCGRCQSAQQSEDRERQWKARVPQELQGFATVGWAELPWHDDARQRGALKGWFARYRRAASAHEVPTCLYVCGSTGVGKSVALARLGHSLTVAEAWADDLFWVRESELIDAHKLQYARGDDGDQLASEGRNKLKRATEVPLLILDELFSLRGEPYSAAAAREIGRVLYERLEARRLTLIASNEPDGQPTLEQVGALFGKTFDQRVASRFMGAGEVVWAWGDDMRRRR